MTENEKKLLQAKHRLEEAEMRDRQKERKARTRRLIQEGAILEKVLPQTTQMTLEQLEDFLCEVFQTVLQRGQAVSQANIPCAVGSIFCTISKTMRWHIATPSRRLPTKTCHRQLLRSYGYRIFSDTHVLFSKEK